MRQKLSLEAGAGRQEGQVQVPGSDALSRQGAGRLTDPVHRDVLRRYIRWQHQRRMNQMDQVSQGTFLRSKQAVTVAIDQRPLQTFDEANNRWTFSAGDYAVFVGPSSDNVPLTGKLLVH